MKAITTLAASLVCTLLFSQTVPIPQFYFDGSSTTASIGLQTLTLGGTIIKTNDDALPSTSPGHLSFGLGGVNPASFVPTVDLFSGVYTFSLWYKNKRSGNDVGSILRRSSSPPATTRDYVAMTEKTTDQIGLMRENGALTTFNSSTASLALTENDNTWHHLVVAADNLSTTYYLDGIQIGNTIPRVCITKIEELGSCRGNNVEVFAQRLDEIAYWPSTLSDAQILTIYSSGQNLSDLVTNTSSNIESLQSGSWSDPTTWVGGVVPASSDNVRIKSGHIIDLITRKTVNDLVVESFSSTTGESVAVWGKLDNTGSIKSLVVRGASRTLKCIGLVANVDIKMDAPLETITATYRPTEVERTFKIIEGRFEGDVEFLSNQSGTAVYDESGLGTWAIGNAYINTHLQSGEQGWRYWSSPVYSPIWTVDGFPIASHNGVELVYSYIESNAVIDYTDGWLANSMFSLSNRPIIMYVGDHPDLLNGGSYTITANGILQTGSFNLSGTMSYTGNVPSNPNEDPRGWRLIGNPFQSSLDWDAIMADITVSNIEPTYYSWDPLLQDYSSYNSTTSTGTGGLDQFIGPHKSVFIKQTGIGATLELTDAHKDFTFRGSGMNRMNTSTTVPTIELSMNSNTRSSPIVLRFDNGTAGFDPLLDSRNMAGDGADLIELSSNNGTNTIDIQVNTLAALGTVMQTIPLSNEVAQFENLVIRLDNSTNMPTGSVVYLYDKSLAIQHDLCQSAYSFTSDQNDVNSRFELRVLPQASVNIETLENKQASIYVAAENLFIEFDAPLANDASIQLFNTLGQLVESIRIPLGQTNYTFDVQGLLKNNVYIVQIPEISVREKIKW
jgi:hypothetical protein